MMKYRRLGRTGIEVSEIGYGAWGIGGTMWIGARDKESRRAVHRAIDLGVNFIDTALTYGNGHSEKLVGEIVRERKERIYVASKIPPKNRRWPAPPGVPPSEAFPYGYIVDCAEQSLRNLRLETIDLLQFHVWHPEWDDSDEWRRAVEDLKRAGKARHFGISINDYQPDSVLTTLRQGVFDTVQVIYNIFDPRARQNLFPLCRELDVGVIVRVPLDEGGLTGKIRPDSEFPEGDFRNLYFRGERKQEVYRRVQRIEEAVGAEFLPIADLALRFCLQPPEVSTVIPGMRTLRHVQANCSIPAKGPLPENVLSELAKHQWVRDFYPRS